MQKLSEFYITEQLCMSRYNGTSEQTPGSDILTSFYQEIDTALLKLYAEENSPILEDLICSNNACVYEDSIECLKKYKVSSVR